MTKNEVSINETIKETSFIDLSRYDGAFNKTTLFMLPAVNIELKNRLINKYLCNAFLDDRGYDHDFLRPIFLLFKTRNIREIDWRELTRMIRTREELKSLYITDYYIGREDNYELVMYVLQVPDNFSTDYYNFKLGKYTKFSSEYKKKFSERIYNKYGKNVESIPWGAISKSEVLKKIVKDEFYPNNPHEAAFVDTLDEIWDAPKRETNYYRYKVEEKRPNYLNKLV